METSLGFFGAAFEGLGAIQNRVTAQGTARMLETTPYEKKASKLFSASPATGEGVAAAARVLAPRATSTLARGETHRARVETRGTRGSGTLRSPASAAVALGRRVEASASSASALCDGGGLRRLFGAGRRRAPARRRRPWATGSLPRPGAARRASACSTRAEGDAAFAGHGGAAPVRSPAPPARVVLQGAAAVALRDRHDRGAARGPPPREGTLTRALGDASQPRAGDKDRRARGGAAALGRQTEASGDASFATGVGNVAEGEGAVAAGRARARARGAGERRARRRAGVWRVRRGRRRGRCERGERGDGPRRRRARRRRRGGRQGARLRRRRQRAARALFARRRRRERRRRQARLRAEPGGGRPRPRGLRRDGGDVAGAARDRLGRGSRANEGGGGETEIESLERVRRVGRARLFVRLFLVLHSSDYSSDAAPPVATSAAGARSRRTSGRPLWARPCGRRRLSRSPPARTRSRPGTTAWRSAAGSRAHR